MVFGRWLFPDRVLQRAKNEFDPIAFDAEAARMFGECHRGGAEGRAAAAPSHS